MKRIEGVLTRALIYQSDNQTASDKAQCNLLAANIATKKKNKIG
jgi:hypothetical protein